MKLQSLMKNKKVIAAFTILAVLVIFAIYHFTINNQNKASNTADSVEFSAEPIPKNFKEPSMIEISFHSAQIEDQSSLKFYKMGSEFLFEFKNEELFFRGKNLFKCLEFQQIHRYLCGFKNAQFLKVINEPHKDDLHEEIKISLNTQAVVQGKYDPKRWSFSIELPIVDLFDSNTEDEMEKPIIANSKSAIVEIDGNQYPLPEDSEIELYPIALNTDIFNKRGKRFLNENPKLREYVNDLHPCLVKEGLNCHLLTDDKYHAEISWDWDSQFVLAATKDIEKYITYNYNRTPCIYQKKETGENNAYCFLRSQNKYGWILLIRRELSIYDHELYNPYEPNPFGPDSSKQEE